MCGQKEVLRWGEEGLESSALPAYAPVLNVCMFNVFVLMSKSGCTFDEESGLRAVFNVYCTR